MWFDEILTYYFRLPCIKKTVGLFDRYNGGKVKKIIFDGELTFVWVEYKTLSKVYRAQNTH